MEELKSFASDAFSAGGLYQNENNVNPQNFTDWYDKNKGRIYTVVKDWDEVESKFIDDALFAYTESHRELFNWLKQNY